MVSTKLCFALVVCALVLSIGAEAAKAKTHAKADSDHAKADTAHAKSATAKADPGPAATWLSRIEKVAKVAGALASKKDDNGNVQLPMENVCYGGIMWSSCSE